MHPGGSIGADQFDILVRSLCFAGTRLILLGFLAALGATGLPLLLQVDENSARRKGKHRRKRNHRHSGRREEDRRAKRMGQAPNTRSACAVVLAGVGCK